MNIVMEPEPRRSEERVVAEAKVEELIESDVPVRSHVEIEGFAVPIGDLAANIIAYRHQKRLLEELQLSWPTALLFRPSAPDVYGGRIAVKVPLDLGVSGGIVRRRREPTSSQLLKGVPQHRVASEASSVGLHVEDIPVGEVSRTFVELVGDIIFRRLKHPKVSSNGPPYDSFTITTTSNRVEVIFCDGYFLNTRQGFGFSTPATRRLPWGQYTFGAIVRGVPVLQDTLWSVPDVTTVHLDY